MKKYRSFITTVFPIVLIVALAVLYRDALRQAVVILFVWTIYFFRLISLSLNQTIVWLGVVIIACITALVSLTNRRPDRSVRDEDEVFYKSRLQFWVKTVEARERSDYFKWHLARDLSGLVITALVYQSGRSRRQILRQLENGSLEIPESIRDYVLLAQRPFNQTGLSSTPYNNIFQRIWESVKDRPNRPRTESAFDIDPVLIIAYVENIMDIHPEPPGT